ncbi:alpha/beta hydrolase [Verminephrobacter aporrectodeae]|uniref:Alpha/beta fold hydrolase n=1 Tax=Verminephrobacter aporrectodeae subsp. tuberculatae TaxID=1110392 RepID=A0ABT3KWT6_9BURK|nr:alpha/beta fold hydrolase [Verminephrobacter aporrectodeae]MCW5222155.1 alpha/beta fold hydrolase [Verminephrobacter aporrectodeae subsp. tuberculatae]MCW5258482.1 alpha/beta fold hydrolase [Verminephrobacter aporrectodeae subsp. tuberculatae]MCW5291446.1 alpha/beta fold hydrolase [Verminephrobacter aporrectodeae subsp. tuberculatae]MCW5322384.1 alpha/beta fold hydrolase [Verminephrobacter aporrectodeae subsp. tuberculatae]MCW8165080.1 alpha/beta fold hydrolase [Verminephrobacter aporrectod
MRRVESSFMSQGLRCASTLLLPDQGERPPPVIVMAHGFACVRAMLMPYARRFAEAGYAVYLFDYRNFGDSAGQPRHWVDPFRHLKDWDAAIAHVQTLPTVDAQRMVLWGTSMSGGHVVCMAARGHRVSAVIAMHPLMSGLNVVAAMPLRRILALTLAGLIDLLGSPFGRPLYLPVVGYPGELAMLTSPGAWDGMEKILAHVDVPWENKALARVALKMAWYNPIHSAHRVRVPTLVIAGSRDSLVSAHLARKAVSRMPWGEFTLHASDHFQPYYGDFLEENVRRQLNFLSRYVGR